MKKRYLILVLLVLSLLSSLTACSSGGDTSLTAPSDLRVSPTSSSIELKWQDNSRNETGFRIFRRLESETTFTPIENTVADTETYIDTGVTASERYIYEVRAFAGSRESPPTSIGEAVTISTLLAPSDLNAVVSDTAITLSWQDNSDDEDGFLVYRKFETDTSFPLQPFASPPADTISYLDTDVRAGTTYHYKVLAFTTDRVSAESNIVKVNTPPASTPSNPTNPTPENPTEPENPTPPPKPVISSLTAPSNDLSYSTGTAVELSWTISEQNNLTELKLERVNTAEVLSSSLTATKTNVTLPNIATKVIYRLTAKNAGGTTSKDIELSIGTVPMIENLESSSTTEAFNLNWTMTGTTPFTFKARFEVESQTSIEPDVISLDVEATVNEDGIYTATVPRPEGEILQAFLLVFSDFGAKSGEPGEGAPVQF
ncbi:MAG: fibronectin type III domain-containing protein [Trueperaceae bacterium]